MFAQDFDAASFVKGFDHNLVNSHDIRVAVRQAKKYVLDVNASRQLCDLAHPRHWRADMKGLRQMARSPHSKIWIEFDNRARRGRLLEILTEDRKLLEKLKAERSHDYVMANVDEINMAGIEEVVPKLAWLVECHEKQPSTHRATLIMGTLLEGGIRPYFSEEERKRLRPIQVMPFAWQWDTEDQESPWGYSVMASFSSEDAKRGDFSDMIVRHDVAEISTGIINNHDKFVSITRGYGKPTKVGKFYKELATEFSGELRYIMAFVASLSASKVVGLSNVTMASHRHASGRTLPAHEVTEVRITLPKTRKLARYIAHHGCTGIKKREHDVERYWRTYTHGTGPFCATKADHLWEQGAVPDRQYCTKCTAWRTWTVEHKRGDKAIGRIEHIKRVTA